MNPMDPNLNLRCNWCDKAMLFHTAFMIRWHRALCVTCGLPDTYDCTPIDARKAFTVPPRWVDFAAAMTLTPTNKVQAWIQLLCDYHESHSGNCEFEDDEYGDRRCDLCIMFDSIPTDQLNEFLKVAQR